jgi:hypothetical protein
VHTSSPLLFGGESGEPEDFAGRAHSVLTAAANVGARDLIKALLDAGADIVATGMWGETPLHTTAWLGYTEIVALLIARGAPLNPGDSENDGTPFNWAVQGSSPEAWADKRDQVGAARPRHSIWTTCVAWNVSSHRFPKPCENCFGDQASKMRWSVDVAVDSRE